MTVTAILVDWCPPYLRSPQAASSLLLAPLGAQPLLRRLSAQVITPRTRALTVLPNFTPDEAYLRALRQIVPQISVSLPAHFHELLDAHEPSDLLLILDARYAPVAESEVHALLRDTSRCRMARHLIQLRGSGSGLEERVVCDQRHRVCAIRRFYDGVTRLEVVGVSCSLISVAAAQHLGALDPFCLTELRARLTAARVPSIDIPASSATLDLTEESALLALNERWLVEHGNADPPDPLRQLAPGIWIGPGCRIHPASRVYGPAIFHENVTVGAGAAVIGPAVLGPGACVEQGAIVSQSVLGAGARVLQHTHLTGRVLPTGATSANMPAPRVLAGWPPATGAAPPPIRNGNGHASDGRRSGSGRIYAIAKRALDFATALAGLIVLSPLLLVAAVAVKLSSRGPVLYGDEREGRGGRIFRCWKFRTMVEDAHARQRELYRHSTVDGPQFKMPRDPRVTLLGRFLRSANVDELPQLINVLRGDMSLVGPRPSPFRENQICVPWREARLSVRPGITGLWQVCRHERPTGDFHQWIYFDTLYVRHRALWLDLRILAATVVTLGGRWGVPLRWMIPAHELRQWDNGPARPGSPHAAAASNAGRSRAFAKTGER